MRAQIVGFSTLSVATLLAPFVAAAATLFNTLGIFNSLVNGVMWLFIAAAVAVFFWGLVEYIFRIGGEKGGEAKGGGHLMLWGIIALFVMVSIWGIIRLLQQTFQVDTGGVVLPGAIQGGTVNTTGTVGATGAINVSGGVSIPIR